MKIAFIIPYFYKWQNYSNVRAHYEYLKLLGHKVDLFSRNEKPAPVIDYNKYDQVWLMGAGSQINEETFNQIKVPVIAFGWSDPNLYSEDHMKNCDLYCTNDLNIFRKCEAIKPTLYYQTTCDKRYHKNLNLKRTTDILVYGMGNHRFVTNRNQIVNKLRGLGFKIKVFGRGWDNHQDTHGFIEGQQFIEEINRAKILLDITNEATSWGHRIFEGSACGTPILTMAREDTSLLLEYGKEIFVYSNFQQLVHRLNYLLKHLEKLREVGDNAQKRCYKDHDISVRIQYLLNHLKGLEK